MPTWFDRFGEEWAKTGNVDDPTIAQANAGWAYIGQAPPTVEQFNSMFQWSDDKDNWLYGQIANVITSVGMVPDSTDLTQLLQAITKKMKILLTAPTTFYVSVTSGNDTTGTGEQNNPWKTIAHALVWIAQHVDLAWQTITIQLTPGTYDAFGIWFQMGGSVIISGDRLNPRSYIVKNPNGSAIAASAGAILYLQGLSVEASGIDTIDYQTWGVGISSGQSAQVVFRDIAFGPCSYAQMVASVAGVISPWDGASNKYSIYGGGAYHILSQWNSVVTNVRNTITIQNNPTFTYGFIGVTISAGAQAWYATYTGTAQGPRANVAANGVLSLAGQNPNTTLPGTSPAIVNTGGQIL